MFCLLVVLAKVSLLANWLARKTPLRKPNRGEGIISIKPRLKSVHDFLALLYCLIVLLCICVVSCPYVIYYPTVMARYSLFVLKVPLNPKQTNKRSNSSMLRHSWSLVEYLFVFHLGQFLRVSLCFLRVFCWFWVWLWLCAAIDWKDLSLKWPITCDQNIELHYITIIVIRLLIYQY